MAVSCMKTQRRTTDEQYQLIMECRSSGLSDYQWCTEHNITSIPAPFTSLTERCVLISSQKTAPYSDILFHLPIEESMKFAGRC